MRKYILLMVGVLASIFVTAGVTTVLSAPAQAGTCTYSSNGVTLLCGSITHYSPDTGRDTPILVRCDYGDPSTNHNVFEGESSRKYCKDTDRVYVRPGEEIWCKHLVGSPSDQVWVWMKARPSADANNPGEYMDATGWYKISNVWSDGQGCTVRAD